MLLNLLIQLSTLSLGLSYVACTTQQQSQLASLNERVNQMISALYSSPLLSKVKASTSSEEASTPSQESTLSYTAPPAPQFVFVSPPSFLETGAQPTEYGYPTQTRSVPRPTWPYPYEYNYQPQITPPAPVYSPLLQRQSYPEYARAYPQLPAQPALPPPFPSPMSYASPFASAQFPTPFSFPASQPGYSLMPSFTSYPSQFSHSPMSSPALMHYPVPFSPSTPYSPPVSYSSPFSQQYAPSLPYPSSFPGHYPPLGSVPYSPSLSPYPPSLLHQHAPAFPKPSDILPQPQYEYSA